MTAPAVGVPDCEHGAGDLAEQAGDVGGVDGDAPERIGRSDHGDAFRQQAFDDAVPTGSVGEGPVHEHDGD